MFYYFDTPSQIAGDEALENKDYLTALFHYETAAAALSSSITVFTEHGSHTPYILTYLIHVIIQTRCELFKSQKKDDEGLKLFLSYKQDVSMDFSRIKRYVDKYLTNVQRDALAFWDNISQACFLTSCIDAYWNRALYLTTDAEVKASYFEEAIECIQISINLINDLTKLDKKCITKKLTDALAFKNQLITRFRTMSAPQENAEHFIKQLNLEINPQRIISNQPSF